MPKNTNKTKKKQKNFNLTTDYYKTISIKFKIHISQLSGKIELKQQSLNQTRHCFTGHIQV